VAVFESYSRNFRNTEEVNRFLAAAALAVFIAALVAIALGSHSSGGGNDAATTGSTTIRRATTRQTTTAPPPRDRAIPLQAVGAYDPEGDQHENDDLAPLAVDGDPATFWKTEHYTHGFFKKGVGLVLDARKPRTISKVVVTTDATGGTRAQIRIGRNPNGPFRAVSPDRQLSGSTVFTLTKGSAGRYVVVWFTALPPAVGEGHVNEVRAFGSN
jgi:hypothetical protein